MSTVAERFDAAVAEWLALCEEHGIPFEQIEEARRAYDDGRHVAMVGALTPLNLLFTVFEKREAKEVVATDQFGDWELGPIRTLAALGAAYLLGVRTEREACAKIADEWSEDIPDQETCDGTGLHTTVDGAEIGRRIRARTD